MMNVGPKNQLNLKNTPRRRPVPNATSRAEATEGGGKVNLPPGSEG